MSINRISFRVRYAETDQMGIVYHGNYAQFLEMGRVSWLRELGFTYKALEENGIILPVVSLTINYIKSATYDDLLTVQTQLKKMPIVKIEFDYKIYNESNDILVEANTVLAFLEKDTKRPIKCPEQILKKISLECGA